MTDPQKAADEVLTGKTDEAAPATSTERVRAYRARKAKGDVEPGVIVVTDADVSMTGTSFALVWRIVAVPFSNGRLKAMTQELEEEAGRAFAPLVKKYLPLVADWQYEIAAGMFMVDLMRKCYVPPMPVQEGEGDGHV